MLSHLFGGDLGQMLAPDENVKPSEEDTSFWSNFSLLLAPDPIYEASQHGPSSSSSSKPLIRRKDSGPPPQAAFSNLSTPQGAPNSVVCQHCNKTTPVSMTPSTPSGAASGGSAMFSPLEQRVVDAAKGTAASTILPKNLIEKRDKVFRLCASTNPLKSETLKRLQKLLGDKSLLSVRSHGMGQLCPDGFTPLMACAYSNQVEAAKMILELDGATKDEVDSIGRSAIHIAAEKGSMDVVGLLQSKDSLGPGAEVDLLGRTPFGIGVMSTDKKARRCQSQLRDVLFSPGDKSVMGNPSPKQHRFYTKQQPIGYSQMPGFRVTMEDSLSIHSWPGHSLVGVCDGHADNQRVSKMVADQVKEVYLAQPDNMETQQERWTHTCLALDQKLKQSKLSGGSTAVWALVTESQVVVANVGDCRCILIQEPTSDALVDGMAKLSVDNKEPHLVSEGNPDHILTKIGGAPALEAVVDLFYEKLVADDALKRFFEGVDLTRLRAHQKRFLTLALTEIPEDMDVADMIHDKHERLFDMGLDETHFDMVATHLVATMKELGVKGDLIDGVVAIIKPLRKVFEDGKKAHLLDQIGGSEALEAVVEIFYEKLVADPDLEKFFEGVDLAKLKKHQRAFLTLALTKVPDSVKVPALIADKHARLFDMGLNETHFDKVASHLVASLEELKVSQVHIDAIVDIISPLRKVFEDGKKIPLLDQIGGSEALAALVDIFYEKLVADTDLEKFFKGVDLAKLKKHQRAFLSLALTKVPDTVNVPDLIAEKHQRLFKMGLDETHFDKLAGHLVASLGELKVPSEQIDAIVEIVGPLRKVFEENKVVVKEPKANCNVVDLSTDHKPSLAWEEARIEKAGLKVEDVKFFEGETEHCVSRITLNEKSTLAVARAFGDFEYKSNQKLSPEDQAVICIPEVKTHTRTVHDQFLVLACDGIWDVMTSEEVGEFVTMKMQEALSADESDVLPLVCDLLLEECIKRNSQDNLSVVMVALDGTQRKVVATATPSRNLFPIT